MKNYKLTINYNENDYCFEGQFRSAEEFLASVYSNNGTVAHIVQLLTKSDKMVRYENIGTGKFNIRLNNQIIGYCTARLDSEEVPSAAAAYYAHEFYKTVMGI